MPRLETALARGDPALCVIDCGLQPLIEVPKGGSLIFRFCFYTVDVNPEPAVLTSSSYLAAR